MNRKRAVREGYDDLAETYDERRSGEGRGHELVSEFAADVEGRVLDAGCGSGFPTAELLAAGNEVVSLDASRAQLDLLGERGPAARPVQGDLARLPFADGAFDAVTSLFAVIHVPREQHRDVLREFRRVLGPGGELLVTMGAEAWEGTNPDWLDSGTEMRWSFYGRERNLDLLAGAGFEVVAEELVDDELGGAFLFVRARS